MSLFFGFVVDEALPHVKLELHACLRHTERRYAEHLDSYSKQRNPNKTLRRTKDAMAKTFTQIGINPNKTLCRTDLDRSGMLFRILRHYAGLIQRNSYKMLR